MQIFVQIQFNHITTKNSFMISVQRVKTKFGQNVLWTFVFQTVQSGTVFLLFSSKQNSQRQNMVNFYSIKHRKFNLRFFCCSVYNTWLWMYIIVSDIHVHVFHDLALLYPPYIVHVVYNVHVHMYTVASHYTSLNHACSKHVVIIPLYSHHRIKSFN